MHLLRFTIIPLFMSSFLVGCGGASLQARKSSDQLVTGDLRPLVLKFKTSKHLSSCDRGNLDKMLEISTAVDQHKNEIESYAADQIRHPISKKFKTVKVGPMVVREPFPGPTPREGWHFFDYSWSEIIDFYLEVQKNPTPEYWSGLNSMVRSIITDDEARILKNEMYAVGYQDEPMLKDLLSLTKSCIDDQQCQFPHYSVASLAWAEKQNTYSSLLQTLRQSARHSDIEKPLSSIQNALEGDLDRFEIYKNFEITRAGNVLHLPLYTNDFSTVTSELSQYIESVWTSKSLSLKVDWKARQDNLFTVFLTPGTGGRSYVSYSEKQVALFNNVGSKSIAHEIGHVLGFPDHYFDVWDDTTCVYHDQYREDDLMSEPLYGQVLDDEWADLQKTYPESTP